MPIIDGCPIKRNPFLHQLADWRLARDLPAWAHLWEQGTGKSCEMVMQASWLQSHNNIDGIFVVAPNGVHRNFVTVEMPAHWPDELPSPGMCWYRASAANTKKHQQEIKDCIYGKGFAVFAMSYDSLNTPDTKTRRGGHHWAKEFLTRRRCLFIADESSRVKTPLAVRTVATIGAARLAAFRRILNGTPVPNGPMDIYSQIRVIDPGFWARKGITSFTGFKNQFGVWGTNWIENAHGVRKPYEICLRYKELDTLQTWLKETSTRVTKEEVLPDLPPKLYKRMEFDLDAKQQVVYDDLKKECMALLAGNELVTVLNQLTQMLRLQQVTCGYVAVDESIGDPIRLIGDKNPRLDLLHEIVEDLPHSTIIWARFRKDIELICGMLHDMKRTFVRYDGTVGDEERGDAIHKFQSTGEAQFFVGTPAAGGEGITLHRARTVIYYSNGVNLQQRLQSEDRAHRIGQTNPVQYIDLVAKGTIDERIVECLVNKFDVARQITGDKLREWIT